LRKQVVKQITDRDFLKLLGLKEDDVIISVANFSSFGLGEPFHGWQITYSTAVNETKQKE